MPNYRFSEHPVASCVVSTLLTIGISFAAPGSQQVSMANGLGVEFRLVRTVSNPFGGTVDLVTIPGDKRDDRHYCREVAEAVCGDRSTCLVNFWTDEARVPTSASMPVTDLQVMTATYERHPSYDAPILRLACWLYSTKPEAPDENCFVMPGVDIPWER